MFQWVEIAPCQRCETHERQFSSSIFKIGGRVYAFKKKTNKRKALSRFSVLVLSITTTDGEIAKMLNSSAVLDSHLFGYFVSLSLSKKK